MATIVNGELYKKLDGQLEEIKRQLRQKDGYPFDPKQLKRGLQLLIEGKFSEVGVKFPCQVHAPELIPDKWEVLEDVEPTENLDVSKLTFVSYLNADESYIGGEEMRKRAVMLGGNLGLSDAPRILAEQAKLSVDLRSYYIVLPGTKLRDSGGGLYVPGLYWRGGRWILDFRWLDDRFGDDGRFALSE